ncbi:RHS repeat domain-containing protein [Pasteurella atlantica]|uniref:RHS repeat domain-containing protein n=1 Tax=Pasteurellaceae TaxID=712 RepID=UPI002747B607|nr:hypothetical protein [Pasteurella atlantica]MDP8104022.1 hypothetical protein [Pasteurella atlantica]MDP8125653.1 hypothetical protein [Pasteurella atlantica]MDP8141416.1 hypothetical protein [Pasteurella atlantica]MDP8157280.1 hypothetical protein [Pasteurella atlantica]
MRYNLSSAVSTVTETDEDGDGNPESTIIKSDTTDDGKLNKTTEIIDKESDGTPDAITNTIIDKHNITTIEKGTITNVDEEGIITVKFDVDKRGDEKGISGRTDRITRDGRGEVLDSEYDFYNDGDKDYKSSFEYNSDGTIKKEKIDLNMDGADDKVISFDYNPDGSVAKEMTQFGGALSSKTYEYYDNGLVKKVHHDKNDDGEPDSSTIYTYYDNGNIKTVAVDNDNDGTLETTKLHFYDDNNNLIKATTLSANHKPIRNDRYTYDENGNQATWEEDFNGDGTYDQLREYPAINDWDQTVERKISKLDAEGNKSPINSMEYTYNEEGRFVESLVTRPSGSQWGNEMSYNDLDQLIGRKEFSIDKQGNKVITFSEENFYNNANEKLFIARDNRASDSDGIIDGNADLLFIYEPVSLTKIGTLASLDGLTHIYLQDNEKFTFSAAEIDKIVSASKNIRVTDHYYSNHSEEATLKLTGGFTETATNDKYVTYTDGAGNNLIVDADITVNII